MKLIALDSSGLTASCAILEDDILRAEYTVDFKKTHSQTLLPMLDALASMTELDLSTVDAIAVAAGPGSFTGLRIGVSAAKGLAWALEKPCCAVSTLEAMAYNALLHTGTVVCAMDARRSQIYNAVFHCRDGVLTRCTPDRAIALSELAEELKNDENPKIIVGDGATLCYNTLLEQGIACRLAPPDRIMQSAAGVALAAEEMVRQGRTVSAQELAPVYLRLSQAERERLAKGLPITVE